MSHICSVLPHIFCEDAVGVAERNSLHGFQPLNMDESYVTFISRINIPLNLYLESGSCQSCEPHRKGEIEPMENRTVIVGTESTIRITLQNEDKVVCRGQSQFFSEYGDYYMEINNVSGKIECSKPKILQLVPYEMKEWPIPHVYIMTFFFLCLFAVTPTIIKYILSKLRKNNTKIQTEYSKTYKPNKPLDRLQSLDTFRGFTVACSIFGNAGAGHLSYFTHNVWHGLNMSELPHGWFNWMLGMSFAICASGEWRNKPVLDRLEKGFRRSSMFIFLNLVVNSGVQTQDLTRISFLGVLTGMGIMNLFILCMALIIPNRVRYVKNRILNFFDFGTLWPQYLMTFLTALIHNAIIFGINVPGCGRGYLGPGGKHMYGKYNNCTGGAIGYIDRMIIGPKRMPYPLPFTWSYAAHLSHDTYGPTGIIGQLVQVYLGLLAGEILLLHRARPNEIYKRWLCSAALLAMMSWLLCNVTFDYCILPNNRRLWTLTHSCNIGLTALFLFTLIHFLTDVKKIWNGWPFYYLGRNSLVSYVGHILTKRYFPFAWDTSTRHLHLTVQHTVQVIWWIIICGYLYNRNIFFVA